VEGVRGIEEMRMLRAIDRLPLAGFVASLPDLLKN
jgi:hypothetical protein